MAVPSESWSVVTSGQVDADSPLDETLMEAMRGNLIHLEEWLGDSYTAAKDHDHDGTNSKAVVGVAANTITGTEILNQIDQGSQVIAATASWAPSMFMTAWYSDGGASASLEANHPVVGWQQSASGSGSAVMFDGGNVRFHNLHGSNSYTFYYHILTISV